ncbi:MAG: hypothetical protein MK364_19625 [Pirellulales bacterium]|nr:hypothetical protein [Pirellulales bacterium]
MTSGSSGTTCDQATKKGNQDWYVKEIATSKNDQHGCFAGWNMVEQYANSYASRPLPSSRSTKSISIAKLAVATL